MAPSVADDALVVDATDGAASPCYQCGVCTATCPWGLVRAEPLQVRRLMRTAQLAHPDLGPEIWKCTTCQACEALCPRGVDITGVMLTLRQQAWRARQMPDGLNNLMWDLYWDGNPWGRPPSERSNWSRGLEVEPYDPLKHEVLYYVGCTTSYDRRAQKVARALVKLLRAAGVSFGVLGDREPCCGEAARMVGQRGYFARIVEQNTRLFSEVGARLTVTTSPHCFDQFLNHHPSVGEAFQPLHYTQYLAQLAQEGRLRFSRETPLDVTYHDPCYLGRVNGIYDEPRQALEAVPGIELAEMSDNRELALCCGGGGGRMWQETPAGERFADLRVAQARDTAAGVIATACPACIACLEDGLKTGAGRPLQVMDVAEIAAAAVEG
ncbi:MAG: (Fe-S)-binding protein [Chloroflexi bacterium]|nr:(Fe-S)-binding protein [Chloroflexota bacterium]